ncbi:MAG: formylglycine-generating enzyme family protein [Pirellula sp.]
MSYGRSSTKRSRSINKNGVCPLFISQNSGSKNHPVGTKKPNAWGIHDGHGSVWEWCSDWYDSKYPKGPLTDPVGPSTGSYRAYRGGGWYGEAANCGSGNPFRARPVVPAQLLRLPPCPEFIRNPQVGEVRSQKGEVRSGRGATERYCRKDVSILSSDR